MKNSLFIFTPCLPHPFHPVHWDQTTIIVCQSIGSTPILVQELFTPVPRLFGTTCHCLSVRPFQLLPLRNIWRHISLTWPFPHRYRPAPWPVDVTELFPRFCCWALIWLLRHWAWLRRGYWRYRSLIDWLIDQSYLLGSDINCIRGIVEKWRSIEKHIQNLHSGHGCKLQRCARSRLRGKHREKRWIKPGVAEFQYFPIHILSPYFTGRINGRRGRGRPRTRWTDNIKEWTKKYHIMTVSEWHKIENDGDPWQPTCWLQMAHNDDDIITCWPVCLKGPRPGPPSWRILTVVWHGEGWAPPCDIAQDSPHEVTTRKDNIPARSSPGLLRTTPSVTHQSRGVKVTNGVPKKEIRARSNTIIGTWNVTTLKGTGKPEELENELTRYNWNILGLCESRLLKAGEKSTQKGHRLYWSGLEDTHEQGVGFIVYKNTVNCVMNCCPISSRLITIRLRASPCNITIIQEYAPTSNYNDGDVEYFYDELKKNSWTRRQKNDIIVVQGDWNAKIGEEACKDWKGECGQHCNINQTIEADGSWNSLATMTWWWQTHLAPTKHPEKSPGAAQTERHATKLTTSWWRNDSKQVWTLPRLEASQEPTLEATMSWSWLPSSYIWRGREKTMQHKDQIWTREAEGPWGRRDLPNKDRRDVCSTLHPRLWHGHGYVDGHLQCSSHWHSQCDPRQIPPSQETLGHNWHPWSVCQTEKAQKQNEQQI